MRKLALIRMSRIIKRLRGAIDKCKLTVNGPWKGRSLTCVNLDDTDVALQDELCVDEKYPCTTSGIRGHYVGCKTWT